MHWTQVYLGVGMAALSGIVAWDAWEQTYDLSWRTAATVLSAVLFVCSGLYLRELHQRAQTAATRTPEAAGQQPAGA